MILELLIERFKRIRVVEIDARGKPVVDLTGRNRQGKSSVIEAIRWVLGGKKYSPDELIHRGDKDARVVALTDAYRVERTCVGDREKLILTTPDGKQRFTKGQTLLDAMYRDVGFDPGEFLTMTPAKQGEVLRQLIGLDWAELERVEEVVYSERRELGRDLSRLEGALAELPEVDAPEGGLEDVAAFKARHDNALRRYQVLAGLENAHRNAIALQNAVSDRLARLERELREAKSDEAVRIEASRSAAAAVEDYDVGETPEHVVEDMNDTAARNELRKQALGRHARAEEVEVVRTEVAALTAQLADIAKEKRRQIAGAKMPVEGLGFLEDGSLTFNGLPLSGASQSERVIAATTIGMKVTPAALVTVKDGSFLDEESRALMRKVVDDAGGQAWIERVTDGDGEGEGFVIEDGTVKGGDGA